MLLQAIIPEERTCACCCSKDHFINFKRIPPSFIKKNIKLLLDVYITEKKYQIQSKPLCQSCYNCWGKEEFNWHTAQHRFQYYNQYVDAINELLKESKDELFKSLTLSCQKLVSRMDWK